MALLDLLTLEEASNAVNTTSPSAALVGLNSGISGQIDELCGPVVARAVTERHDGGTSSILIRTTPILTVTTVTEYGTTGSPTVLSVEDEDTKPAAGYLLESRDHFVELSRRAGGVDATFTSGRQNVVVVTSAGRCATTETVPAAFKQAASSILRATWQQEAGRWAQSPAFIDLTEIEALGSFVSVGDMIRRRLPGEMLVGGLA